MVEGLRLAFFGTPEFAVPTLEALLAASPHTVVGVVTQPDRPRGRGQRVSDAPVKARAVAAGLPLLQPERMKDPVFLNSLAAWHADLGVVAAYGKILTDTVLATPRLGMINVHASLLPRYRGAAPVHRAIIDGELATGVTIMRVVKALDGGPMLAKERREIGQDETSDEVEHDLARLGSRLLVAVVDQIARGSAQDKAQDDAAATYAHRLTKDDGAIDWSWPAVRVHNLIRGLHPWPHAFSFLHGRRLILLRSRLVLTGSEALVLDARVAATEEPGTILDASGEHLVVATGAGSLQLLEVQVEGRRPMGAREFLAGHPLKAGDRFAASP